ncbi:unnamed protein product, partial [Ixodes persulcatus]
APSAASLPPPTAELVGALTSALRAAFPEINPPRRPHFPPMDQSIPHQTDDDEEDLLFRGFASTQDPPVATAPGSPTTTPTTRLTRSMTQVQNVTANAIPATSGTREFPPVHEVNVSSPRLISQPGETSGMPSSLSTGPVSSHGSSEHVMLWSCSSSRTSWHSGTASPPCDLPPSCGFLRGSGSCIMSPSQDGQLPFRATQTPRPPTFWEPRS